MSKAYPEIRCNATKLDISTRMDLARLAVGNGVGWVWNHKGMLKRISRDELVEMIRLYENATANKDSRTRVPNRCRYFYWGIKETWRKPVRLRLPPSIG